MADFAELGLSPQLVSSLLLPFGFEGTYPYSRGCHSSHSCGLRSFLGQAATGTGKTAAFALPLLLNAGRLAKSLPIR